MGLGATAVDCSFRLPKMNEVGPARVRVKMGRGDTIFNRTRRTTLTIEHTTTLAIEHTPPPPTPKTCNYLAQTLQGGVHVARVAQVDQARRENGAAPS